MTEPWRAARRVRIAPGRVERGRALALAIAGGTSSGGLGCGADGVVTLGQAAAVPVVGDSVAVVGTINGPDHDDNVTLTGDLLEVYFTSTRDDASGDVWRARRSSRSSGFGAPEPVIEANTPGTETSPAISADGLTLWFGSDRELGQGGIDIWVTRRASREPGAPWQPAENVAELNGVHDDIPRPLALGERVMPFASRRADGDTYQTYLARRERRDGPFASIEGLTELWLGQSSMVDAFLSEDGRFIFFNREGPAGGDLYFAWRRSPDEPFRAAAELGGVNSAADERDPWLSADGAILFFARDAGGGQGRDIYAASISLPRFE